MCWRNQLSPSDFTCTRCFVNNNILVDVQVEASIEELAQEGIQARLAVAQADRDQAQAASQQATAAVEAGERELAGDQAGDGRDESNRSLQERLADAQNAQVSSLVHAVASSVVLEMLLVLASYNLLAIVLHMQRQGSRARQMHREAVHIDISRLLQYISPCYTGNPELKRPLTVIGVGVQKLQSIAILHCYH